MARSRRGRFRLPQEGSSRAFAPARWIAGTVLALALGAGLWWWLAGRAPRPVRVPASNVRPSAPAAPSNTLVTLAPPPAEPAPRPLPPVVAVSTNLIQRTNGVAGPLGWDAPTNRTLLATQLVARMPTIAPAATNLGNARTVPPAEPASPVPGDTNLVEAKEANGWIPRAATNVLEAQIALAAFGISAGSIDGVGGAQTAAALRAFQMQQGLEQTGRLDPGTVTALKLRRPPFGTFMVETGHVAGLRPVPSTWLGKSSRSWLGFETLIELVAESSHSHPAILRQLNPGVDWAAVGPGMRLVVPQPAPPPGRRAARIRISLAGRYLRVFDDRGNLLAHFPCSIGRVAARRPVGDLHVATVVKDPNYTFDPRVFPESDEGRRLGRKLIIPPGPNNPVGVAWIGLDRPGYGIHGTPGPEQVGRTESHGCFRLANWNADFLRRVAWVGLPVSVEP